MVFTRFYNHLFAFAHSFTSSIHLFTRVTYPFAAYGGCLFIHWLIHSSHPFTFSGFLLNSDSLTLSFIHYHNMLSNTFTISLWLIDIFIHLLLCSPINLFTHKLSYLVGEKRDSSTTTIAATSVHRLVQMQRRWLKAWTVTNGCHSCVDKGEECSISWCASRSLRVYITVAQEDIRYTSYFHIWR